MNNYYPKIENQEALLKNLCKHRLYDLYEKPSQELEQRLDYELDIINKTNTTGIFIILNRVFRSLKIKSYQFGLRGLIGGSLVAYLCGISNVDPVKYGLSQYVTFGVRNTYKVPDININLNTETDLKFRLINEIEACDEIYKMIPIKSKSKLYGNIESNIYSYYIIPIIHNYNDDDYRLLINRLDNTSFQDINEFYKIYLLSLNSIKVLEELINDTGNDLSNLDIDNADIVKYISDENYEEIFDNIFVFNYELIVDIANMAKPKTFYDLVKIISLAHGDGVWDNNFKNLINDKKATLQDIISNRDDLFDILVNHNVSIDESYKIMEEVRKGRGNIYREQYKRLSNEHNLPNWFTDSCSKIKYLFPKAHAISYTLIVWKLLWFKIHSYKEFNQALEEYKEIKKEI